MPPGPPGGGLGGETEGTSVVLEHPGVEDASRTRGGLRDLLREGPQPVSGDEAGSSDKGAR